MGVAKLECSSVRNCGPWPLSLFALFPPTVPSNKEERDSQRIGIWNPPWLRPPPVSPFHRGDAAFGFPSRACPAATCHRGVTKAYEKHDEEYIATSRGNHPKAGEEAPTACLGVVFFRGARSETSPQSAVVCPQPLSCHFVAGAWVIPLLPMSFAMQRLLVARFGAPL